MPVLLSNNPISYEIPVVETVEELTRVGLFLNYTIAAVAFLCMVCVMTTVFEDVTSKVPRTIGYFIAVVFSACTVVVGAYTSFTGPEPKPRTVHQTTDKDISAAIEEDYQIAVDDLDGKVFDDGWKFTALTDQGRYKCDAVVLEENRYTVYCNEKKGRVSLDKLLDGDF